MARASTMKDNPQIKRTEHILLVDDEPDLLAVNSKLLGALGFEVSTTTSGADAVDRIEGQEIDLVILDMMMPVMDGVETLREIRSRVPGQKVVILSAFAEDDQVRDVKALGISAYLKKPLELSKMSAVIRQVLDGKVVDDVV